MLYNNFYFYNELKTGVLLKTTKLINWNDLNNEIFLTMNREIIPCAVRTHYAPKSDINHIMAYFRDVCFLIKLLEHGFFAWQYWALQMQEIIMERWHHWLLDGLRPLLECLLAPVQGKISYYEVTFPKNLHSEVQSIQHVTSDRGVWHQSSGEQDHSLDGLMIILIISGGIQLLAQWLVGLLVSYSFKTFKCALLTHGRQHLNWIFSWNDILFCYNDALARRKSKETFYQVNFELLIRRHKIMKKIKFPLHKWS